MVAADGTFIEAPSSTKNKAHARDPEMASGKKANTWHFGMKEHIAACSESSMARSPHRLMNMTLLIWATF